MPFFVEKCGSFESSQVINFKSQWNDVVEVTEKEFGGREEKKEEDVARGKSNFL